MPLSSWPATPLPIRGELFIGGVWTDITSRVRLANEISIQGRGRANEQGSTTPCTCSFTLNNRDGLFNNRNPNSIYYGKLPRNLPVRFSVTEDRSFAIYPDIAGATRVKTTDKASVRIVGDIDVRVEVDIDNQTQGTLGQILCGRYVRTASNSRSWLMFISAKGELSFNWTTDGTAATIMTDASSVQLPTQFGPMALRAVLDVDNGAAGNTVTFYTSDTISGTWTQLGAPIVRAGITSIFAGTGDIELGRLDNGADGIGVANETNLIGRVYAFELRNGIGGTVVANAAIYNQPRGTTSWSDGLASPNTWTTNGTVEITPDDRRFVGEISALPLVWDPSGKDVYVQVEAADVTRRLGKGAVPVTSPLKQYFGALAATGYWPMEDGSAATSLQNAAPKGLSGRINDVQFGTPSDLPATAGSMTINSTATRVYMNAKTVANTGNTCVNWAMKMPSLPASSTTLLDVILTGGTVGRINFSVTNTSYNLACYDTAGALITSAATLFAPTSPINWNLLRIQVQQVAANVQVDLGWYQKNDLALTGAGAMVFAGTAGRISQAIITGTTQNISTQYAHMFIGQFFLNNADGAYLSATNAFVGERAAARYSRIALQNGMIPIVIGDPLTTEPMGAQALNTPITLMQECADTENGFMYPDRNSLAMVLRTRRSLINQYGPSINYHAAELGTSVPQVTDDDGLLRNSVTATRPDGSTGFAYQDTGPNSTASPTATPPGVGVVPGGINRNPQVSDRLNDMASFDVFLGTWDEPRWTSIDVSLERANFTGSATKLQKGHGLAKLDVGDMFTMTNPPTFLPPDDIKVLVQGYKEVLGNRTWRFTWNTSQAAPFLLADGAGTQSLGPYRVAAANCTITAGFTSTATGAAVFTITTAAGSTLWGTTALKPGNFPLDVIIAGEVITLSGITGTTSPQTANVSVRSKNGIVKAHLAGEIIQVANPFYVGL